MTWESVLAIAGPAAAIVFAYVAFLRNKKKDDSAAARQDGQVLSELGYMKSGIDDIKAEIRDQRKTNMEIYDRLSHVEAKATRANERLDRIEGREY